MCRKEEWTPLADFSVKNIRDAKLDVPEEVLVDMMRCVSLIDKIAMDDDIEEPSILLGKLLPKLDKSYSCVNLTIENAIAELIKHKPDYAKSDNSEEHF